MSNGRMVRDLMIDIFEYPHIPYWFTIRQAIGITRKFMLDSDKCFNPMAILVFDEKYNLMGSISLKEILKGLEPAFLGEGTKAQGLKDDTESLSLVWSSLFTEESRALAERPVRGIMVPISERLAPDDPLTKAAFIMVHKDVMVLPVIDGRKIVGIIRMKEVFEEIVKIAVEK